MASLYQEVDPSLLPKFELRKLCLVWTYPRQFWDFRFHVCFSFLSWLGSHHQFATSGRILQIPLLFGKFSNLSDSLESFFSISSINSAHIPCSHLLWHKSPLLVLHLSGGKKPPDVFVTVILQVGIGRNWYPQRGVILTHNILSVSWMLH